MKVHVLFFGATAAAVGMPETFFELGENAKVDAITDLVFQEHPELKSRNLLFAINEEYVKPDASLSEGDELAIFTPVSGG